MLLSKDKNVGEATFEIGGAFECVSRAGNKYVLVMHEYLTKWPEVYAVPDRKAETVARC